ncbi:S41 family peptidase [Jeotgalibacillus proteolyticus]|uniref:S41 family peptidase n=1 Tax=Jeotgalibacillus proteolyticus TaxID=2082395 RepID=UPI003CF4B693
MRSKIDIFKDIQSILENDYAGYLNKQDLNHPEQYQVTDEMSDDQFEEIMKSYLYDFKDGHLGFSAKDTTLPHRGFLVRRYEDALFVTEANQENRLSVGDKITRIDGKSIDEAAVIYQKPLENDEHERQFWNVVMPRVKCVQIERDGEQFELQLAEHEFTYEPEYSFQQINSQTCYIKITDFLQEEPILTVIEDNSKAIEQSENLIIDVRVNKGGNDSFYFELLNYIFGRELDFSELFTGNEVMLTNYTERNAEVWIAALEEYLEQDLDGETARMIREDISLFRENTGKGLLEVKEDLGHTIKGRPSPTYVYVLSDYQCGSSGDTFVRNAKKSPKVTVVGRPTMGIMDYFNVATIDYGDFEFWYGVSKMHDDYLTHGKGEAPHMYIPWTPEHAKKDIDLEVVMKLIKEEKNIQKGTFR